METCILDSPRGFISPSGIKRRLPRPILRPRTSSDRVVVNATPRLSDRPRRPRLKSWSSDGEIEHILRPETSYDSDSEDFTDHEEEWDESEVASSPWRRRARLCESNPQLTAVPAAALNQGTQRTLSVAALALQHHQRTAAPAPARSAAPLVSKPQQKARSVSPTVRRPRRRRVDPLIPATHPLKIAWDILTVLLSFANAYATHVAIRDRNFQSPFIRFCEIWFICDILLNFCTQRTTSDGMVLQTYQAVWARYLTSWFVVDVLSLFPGEKLYLQPIIEMQKRRNIWKKTFFRTKAVVRVTHRLARFLRIDHIRWFHRFTRTPSKAVQWVRFLIRYIPKYILFLRHMKGVVALRLLRQIRYLRTVYRLAQDQRLLCLTCSYKPVESPEIDETVLLTDDEDHYEDWEVLEDDDPF